MKGIVHISAWIVCFAAVIVMVGFVNQAQDSARCWNVEIEIDRSNKMYFVNEEDIQKIIISTAHPLVGQPISDIDLAHIENQLNLIQAQLDTAP